MMAAASNPSSKRWMLLISFSGVITVVLGLTLAWLNIERTDLAYGLKTMQGEAKELEDHVAKLRVERDNLLAPYRLEKMAEKLGLDAAKAGQIRRMGRDDG